MPLALEHLKLLHPKVASFEMGTGGTPDVSWHEVCDMLARVSMDCRHYARFAYAQDPMNRLPLVDAVTNELFKEDQQNKRPCFKSPVLWRLIVDLALLMVTKRLHLTRRQKREEVGFRSWRRHHEKALQMGLNSIDVLDYELRLAIHDWNRDSHADLFD